MISTTDLDAIKAWALETGPDEAGLEALREKLEGPVRFTFCFDDDIVAAKPVVTEKNFNIYLVGGGEDCNGCVSLTNDFDIASGVVIAEVDPEDD